MVLGLVLALSAAFLLYVAIRPRTSGGVLQLGDAAPAFAIPKLDGIGNVGTPMSGGAHGRPLVVLFFGDWCSLCHTELPALAKVVRMQQRSSGTLAHLVVIGVDSLDSPAAGASFAKASGVTFPFGSDQSGLVIDGKYGFQGDPYVVFINGSGHVEDIHPGPLSPSEFVQLEKSLLASH